ncbi:unnamed protein product, partial [Mesorhabditis belari]|uniref:FYVE-type domain-containing protein n=1 Tax=Mesorhabditis belari TaxID=2138241 RepID=A0AAF3ECY6_9BILA
MQEDASDELNNFEDGQRSPGNDDLLGNPQSSQNVTGICEMCQNYETNLTIMQDGERKLKEELKAMKELADRYQNELSAERDYRREMEKRMTEEAEIVDGKAKEILANHERLQQSLALLTEKYNQLLKRHQEKGNRMKEKLDKLSQKHLDTANKYLVLLGVNRTKAREMRDEVISLPDDQMELQLQCLTNREQLIEARAALEYTEREKSDEITMLRAQLMEETTAREAMEKEFGAQISDLQTELTIRMDSVQTAEQQKRQIGDLQASISELEAQVQQVLSERNAVEQTAQNYKARCSSLQQELDTCEQVQKDFVKLSQSLQIQLEKIRQSEQEVRWQFDEDVDQCQECSSQLPKGKPKPHCRHCGRIFCGKCLEQSVHAGPTRRLASVCPVCHTLLNRESAPFFSKD